MDSKVEIRVASTKEDVESVNRIAQYAFELSPDEEGFKRRMYRAQFREETHYLILSIDGKDMATASLFPMTQHVRGKIMDMGGVATIATLPEGRRKGNVNRLMNELFQFMHDNKIPVSTLHPFKEWFYARYGYTSLPRRRRISFEPRHLRPVLDLKLNGTVEQFHSAKKLDEIHLFMKEIQEQYPGKIMFTRKKLGELKDKPRWVVFAKDNEDNIIGCMLYRIKGYLDKLECDTLYYSNALGKYILLQHLALHIDQVEKVEVTIPARAKPDMWVQDFVYDIDSKMGAMARIMDISLLNGIKVGEGKITLGISDEYCNWNEGTWSFESIDGKLFVERIEKNPELTISISTLSSLIYGYYSLSDLELYLKTKLPLSVKQNLEAIFPYEPHYIGEYY